MAKWLCAWRPGSLEEGRHRDILHDYLFMIPHIKDCCCASSIGLLNEYSILGPARPRRPTNRIAIRPFPAFEFVLLVLSHSGNAYMQV